MAEEKHNWLRLASNIEKYFEVGHRKKLLLMCDSINLSTSSSKLPELMPEALRLLYRKVPVLRVCLRWREGHLWLREMDECRIDFEMKTGTQEMHQDEMCKGGFDTDLGPLWKVVLLKEEDDDALTISSDTPRPFLYNYILLLGIHHSVADGITTVKILGFLKTILDDLLSGRPVDDTEQLGDHVSYDAALKLYAEEERKLKEDPKALEEAMKELSEGEKTRPLLLDILPRPNDGEATTHNIPLCFNENKTKSLIQKCKEERVTIHTFLTSAFNLALIEFLREHGVPQDIYNFRAGHDVSLFRYYDGDTSRILGVRLPSFGFRFNSTVRREELHKDFWTETKEFHQRFHSALSSKTPLRSVVLRQLEQSKFDAIEDYFSDQGLPNYYYGMSNIGDVTKMLSKGGDHIQITRLIRKYALRNKKVLLTFNIHTFRDRLEVNMLYSTYFFKKEYAVRLADLVRNNILLRC